MIFFHKILILLISSALLFGCKKEIDVSENLGKINKDNGAKTSANRTVNISLLAADTSFINLANETYEFLDFISQTIQNSGVDYQNMITNVSGINDLDLSYEDQIENINTLFGEDLSSKISDYLTKFSFNWRIFKENFPEVTEEDLETAALEVLEENSILQMRILALSGECGWRYYLCSAAATAGAILCHGGCDATALATTAGLGIPACVVLCGTAQAYALTQCYDSYCD